MKGKKMSCNKEKKRKEKKNEGGWMMSCYIEGWDGIGWGRLREWGSLTPSAVVPNNFHPSFLLSFTFFSR